MDITIKAGEETTTTKVAQVQETRMENTMLVLLCSATPAGRNPAGPGPGNRDLGGRLSPLHQGEEPKWLY